MKYTEKTVECPNCGKSSYFLVTVGQQGKKTYYVTQCPKCKHYDEIRLLTPKETEFFFPKVK